MKILIFIILLLGSFKLPAQSLDSIGTDNEPFLNNAEVILLHSLLENHRGSFDFNDKKVAFVTGSSGSMIQVKSEFFKDSVEPWVENQLKPQIFMVLLTEAEKKKSGGYDVLVLSWVKLFTDRRKRKIVEQLGGAIH